MNIETFRSYCLSKKGVEESFPFGGSTLAFKVMGKLFALCDVDQFDSYNLKCDPERCVELRENFPDEILPGYHMNKKHWNTILTESSIPLSLALELIDHSYTLVVDGLPKVLLNQLNEMP